MRLWIFTDFDGTISDPDTINLLGRLFDRSAERAVMREKLFSGRIRPREFLSWEIGLVDVPLQEALKVLRRDVVIDLTFPAFADWCRTKSIPLTIVSNGLEEIIRALLEPFGMDYPVIEANHLREGIVPWEAVFRDDSSWGHDKAAYLRNSLSIGYDPVFIGDGVSDREAAMWAKILFAKEELAKYCEKVALEYQRFKSFAEVQATLEGMLREF
jgi:HAD superfamily phosphoserine phosphatase-like hydrolase